MPLFSEGGFQELLEGQGELKELISSLSKEVVALRKEVRGLRDDLPHAKEVEGVSWPIKTMVQMNELNKKLLEDAVFKRVLVCNNSWKLFELFV